MILAPMANVTDSAFRRIVMECGRPDLFFNEFVSCEGLCSAGREKLLKDLQFTKKEKPIIAQFFGSKPEHFYECAQLAKKLGFDGIDINMGCPDRGVEKSGGGAALIKNPELAQKIIKETIRGADGLPVSVKTRLGYNKIETDTWFPYLLNIGLSAITIHGRTRKEMSDVPAHWDEIGKIAQMAKGTGTLIIGNGDIKDLADAKLKAKTYDLDGIMVGRGIFENPWFFNPKVKIDSVTPGQRIKLMLEHIKLFEKLWQGGKHFDVLKKFFKVYISGFDGAKELRVKLMGAKNRKEVLSIVKEF